MKHPLQRQIEDFYRCWQAANPLAVKARQGGLTEKHVSRFLNNVLFLVKHTPVHLQKAIKVAEASGRLDLAQLFTQKFAEEVGHDEWAERDLWQATGAASDVAKVLPEMQQLVDFVAGLIDDNPELYLSYILFSEYFTVLATPAWVGDLEKHCGLPGSSLSILSNHAKLDQNHVEEGLAAMRDCMSLTLAQHQAILHSSSELYRSFCVAVAH